MKKERLYLYDFLEEPPITYPAWYLLSPKLHRDENLKETLRAIHCIEFENYRNPKNLYEIFDSFKYGIYPIYKERYATGYFGNRVMILESSGWKSLNFSQDSINLDNWLIV